MKSKCYRNFKSVEVLGRFSEHTYISCFLNLPNIYKQTRGLLYLLFPEPDTVCAA